MMYTIPDSLGSQLLLFEQALKAETKGSNEMGNGSISMGLG